MRAVLVALLLAPTIAQAQQAPRVSDVFENRVINRGVPRPTELSISRKIYINNCKPGGCVVTSASFGQDSSLTNRSSIPSVPNGTTVTLDAYMWPDEHWENVAACVRETMHPFNIEILTEPPANGVSHHEVMVGGTADQLRQGLDAGGIAPFIDCGATADNTLVFVFANQTSDIQYLCAAIAHEAGHAFGLSHSMDADDPMTYMDLGSEKTWQNSNANCGTDSNEACECANAGTTSGTSRQNSFKYLQDQFGLNSALEPTTITIDRPIENQWVKPNFPISARYDSPLELNSGTIGVGNQTIAMLGEKVALFAWNAPDLPGGVHTITISVTDEADRTATDTVNVRVLTTCEAGCAEGTACLNDLCQPLAGEVGGLGSSCANNAECVSETCASDGSESLCSATCDAGNTCPAGFECLSGANLCWPEGSGGCSTTGSSAPTFLLIGLAGLFVVRRRRR